MAISNKDVVISIQHQLEALQRFPFNSCIHKVPEYLFEGKRKCYEPLVVSIGPLHYNKPVLKSFHEMKLRHLQCFLQSGNHDYDLGQYINLIRGWEDQMRSCYAEKLSLSSNEFIEMVFIDAAFIIVLFLQACNLFPAAMHPIEDRFEVGDKLFQDLFLIENQLPFFVLDKLFDKAFGVTYKNNTFKGITFAIISNKIFHPISLATDKIEQSRINHLVDFVRIFCLPTILRQDRHQPLLQAGTWHDVKFPKSVKQLKAAGVKFRKSESRNLLDISFLSGVLHIPTLRVEDITESILRNISFFEQCHHSYNSYIMDYLAFIDALIDTPEDVQILVQHGIISNWLGSDEEVATLFNQITKDVVIYVPHFYYARLCEDLNAYANTRWNKWKAELRKDYFNHPWSIISLIYLVALLILTMLQVYTGFK